MLCHSLHDCDYGFLFDYHPLDYDIFRTRLVTQASAEKFKFVTENHTHPQMRNPVGTMVWDRFICELPYQSHLRIGDHYSNHVRG